VVPETSPKMTNEGLLPSGDGWFVLNAREARWRHVEGLGSWPSLEGEANFPQLGMGLTRLDPGEPMAMYHWETDQEDFLVLAGNALLIVEGQQRPLRQWDFVHCPPGTNHAIVGAGTVPCLIFAVGARENHTYRAGDGTIQGAPDWGAYTVDESASRHGAGVQTETTNAKQAYARFPEAVSTSYRDGWLPG
jgi:quercetin dioxygenase-like cupin family protein